jgi:quercetin dioxygenase-like cupin family protein
MAIVAAWEDIDAAEVYPGIFRQVLVTTENTIGRYTYDPGCEFPVHEHPEEQVTIVHTGEIEFEVAGAPVILRAGQVAVIPGGTPHGARVTGSEVVITDNIIASANRAPLTFNEGTKA